MKILSRSLRHSSATLLVAIAASLLSGGRAAGDTTLFFDDFSGPSLNSVWQASLPNYGNAPSGASITYMGAPIYSFTTLNGSSVLHMTNWMTAYQRRGWSESTVLNASNFRCEVRFNTLNQSSATSIDGFLELTLLDASNRSRYDIVSPFGANWSEQRQFASGSSIDNSFSDSSYAYQNNTWYRLVLQGAPGQNIRASLCDDNDVELIGRTLNHTASAFGNGFEIALLQSMGSPYTASPSDVAIDFVKVTTVPEPGSLALMGCGLAGALVWARARRRAGAPC